MTLKTAFYAALATVALAACTSTPKGPTLEDKIKAQVDSVQNQLKGKAVTDGTSIYFALKGDNDSTWQGDLTVVNFTNGNREVVATGQPAMRDLAFVNGRPVMVLYTYATPDKAYLVAEYNTTSKRIKPLSDFVRQATFNADRTAVDLIHADGRKEQLKL